MNGRLVWVTQEQRDFLARASDPYRWPEERELMAAWDAAPADPAEAAHSALCSLPPHDMPHYPGVAARAVLAALGVPPEASP